MSSPQPRIRRGRGVDLAAVVALLKSCGLPTADLARAPDLHLWVFEENDTVFGAIGMQRFGACALLRSLAVGAGHQRRGFGRQLVARLEREAEVQGVEQLVLLTESAEGLFRAAGYEVIDRRFVPEKIKQSAEFQSLCPASAVCMKKLLASSCTEVPHG